MCCEKEESKRGWQERGRRLKKEGETNLIERDPAKEDESERDDEARSLLSGLWKDGKESVLKGHIVRGGELYEVLTQSDLLMRKKMAKRESQRGEGGGKERRGDATNLFECLNRVDHD